VGVKGGLGVLGFGGSCGVWVWAEGLRGGGDWRERGWQGGAFAAASLVVRRCHAVDRHLLTTPITDTALRPPLPPSHPFPLPPPTPTPPLPPPRQYDRRESAAAAPPDDHTLWLWFDADWRKWEEEDPWHWQAEGRRRWAGDLLRQQAARQQERRRYQERRERERCVFWGWNWGWGWGWGWGVGMGFGVGVGVGAEKSQSIPHAVSQHNTTSHRPHQPINQPQPHKPQTTDPPPPNREKQQAEGEREGKRRAKYGGAAHNPWASAGVGVGGGGGFGRPAGTPKRRQDFLGYYRLMGIDPGGEGECVCV